MYQKAITKVSSNEIAKIIESRTLKGLFYCFTTGLYIGCDNSTGNAWVEEFKTEEICIAWLSGEFEVGVDND